MRKSSRKFSTALLHSVVGLWPSVLMCESLQVSDPKDDAWMQVALEEAGLAAERGEVPVAALVVRDQRLLAKAHNLRETTGNPTAHAEILAVAAAAQAIGSWRLEGCDLFVTLEPCAMCAGALVNARVRRLVFGAKDPKGGFCGSLGDIVRDPRLNHRLEVVSGVQAEACAEVLRGFFTRLRSRPKQRRPTLGSGLKLRRESGEGLARAGVLRKDSKER